MPAEHGAAIAGLSRAGTASPRPEVRVVSLVARHLTNAEIADQLFVSTLTVKSHLTRVFAKLGVADRRQLAETATVHLSPGDT
jgi:DNA-binding CsgD family transcriptional regulator